MDANNSGASTNNAASVASNHDLSTLSAAVAGLADCDNKLRHLATMTAALRKERAAHGETILQFMDANQTRQIDTRSGKRLTCTVSRPFKPLTRKDLTSILAEYDGLPTDTAENIVDFIIQNRPRQKESRKVVQKVLPNASGSVASTNG